MPDSPIDASQFDPAVTPAEDFYRYVNAGWLDANPIPPEYPAWGAMHEVNQRNQDLIHGLLQEAATTGAREGKPARMAGDYWAAAMDEATIADAGAGPLQPLLARIEAAGSLDNIRALALDLQRSGVGVLHSLGIAPDFEDSDAYLVYIGQGGLGLPERDYYTRVDERSTALREAYAGHIARQLQNLGDAPDTAADAAAAILGFETRLAEPSYPAEKMRDVQLTLNRFAVADLEALMPTFGLTGYLAALGNTLPSVCVDNPGFFSALDTTLSETPLESLRAYLRFHLIRAYANALSPAFEREGFEFYGKTLSGQEEMRPRWKRVIEAATTDVGELVAQLYVAEAFSEGAKQRCEELVGHLLSAMGVAIRGAEWMTEATKAQALEKLAGFGYKIGYPDEWRDYAALAVGRASYAENRMSAARFEYDREFGRLGEPVDKAEWAMPAHMVNAYYHPLLNEVVFPAGILQPPFFYADADDAVNFGAIGAVIGHEITHGFDDQGSHFDASGALRDWWTTEDREEFTRRAEVLVNQYDGFFVADDLHVNGRLTLGENIADLGGVTVALNALREAIGPNAPSVDGLTPERRFFISYATVWRINHRPEYLRLLVNVDPHSPAKFRVNGPLSNLPAFADAFKIADGSPMMRPADERAKVW